MLIGLTYDLRSAYLAMGYSEDETAEFDREDTVEAIESALRTLGHETVRVGNARDLTARLAAGARWDLVFNIAEGLNGIGREAQVPAILDVYGIPYTFSDPLVMSLTLHKGMTKRVVRDAGLPTAEFAVVTREADAPAVGFEPPYFVKPVAEGTGKGITPKSIVWRRNQLKSACSRLIEAYGQPVLVERFLPGREFTVGIVGTGSRARVLGTVEVVLLDGAEKQVYSYRNKEKCEELVEYRLRRSGEEPVVQAAEKIALAAWTVLECRDGGRVDLRCDEIGTPQFMEVNPLAGLHPAHSDLPIIASRLDIPYTRLIDWILGSALERVCPPGRSRSAGKRRCA